MEQTPAPSSFVPGAPQGNSGTAGRKNECGSSISRNASVKDPLVSRLVTGALNVRRRSTCGTGAPAGVGGPPSQLRTTSPALSVSPSQRIVGITADANVHCKAVPEGP